VLNVTDDEIAQRVRDFQRLVAFEQEMPEQLASSQPGVRA
jgi:hypothetical protein